MRSTLILVLLLLSSPLPLLTAAETNRISFAVACYDVGADALARRPGVLQVEKGWQGFREVNRVDYDPQQVSVEQLEQWLKEVDTWRATLPH